MASSTALRWTLAGDEAQAPLFEDGLPSGARDLPGVEYMHVRARTIISRVPAGLADAVPAHDQRLSRLHARLRLLLRAPDASLPRPRRRRRLRAQDRRQGQRGRTPPGRAAFAEVAGRPHRHGHQHRSLPAGRGPLPSHARTDRGALTGAQPVLDPDEVDDDPPRPRPARRGRETHDGRRQLLDRHARRARLAHAPSRAPLPRASASRRCGASSTPVSSAACSSRRCCPASPTHPSSSRRSSAPASTPERPPSRPSSCICDPACASSTCHGCNENAPTSLPPTRRCTPPPRATRRRKHGARTPGASPG